MICIYKGKKPEEAKLRFEEQLNVRLRHVEKELADLALLKKELEQWV